VVTDQRVQLQIADQGIGISKEHLSRVFNKFYRIPTGNIHNVKGFGLGLYYVKSICEAHGWQLRLSSEKGKGTTVDIVIPQYKTSMKQHLRSLRLWWLSKIRYLSTRLPDPL